MRLAICTFVSRTLIIGILKSAGSEPFVIVRRNAGAWRGGVPPDSRGRERLTVGVGGGCALRNNDVAHRGARGRSHLRGMVAWLPHEIVKF